MLDDMILASDIPVGLASSAQSLDQLRAQARQSPEQTLRAAAQQFEAVFLNMMLKSMRDATPQDGPFDSEQTRMFTSMLDQQLAQNMASRGIGLADIMVRQLSHGMEPDKTLPLTASQTPKTGATPSISNPTSVYGTGAQQEFIQRMLPHALQASRDSGVSAQLIMGQAALESGWGQREIRLPDGSTSYNLFGIKAGSNWNGKVAEVTTTEYHYGIAGKQVEKFRAYASYAEAFTDYARLLSGNPRYAGVLQAQGVDAAARALQDAGYATDPGYAEKLVRVMNKVNTLA